jgi:hypothetical protein
LVGPAALGKVAFFSENRRGLDPGLTLAGVKKNASKQKRGG